MRRTNRCSRALVIAVLLLAGLAPAAAAEAPLSPAGWFGSLGDSVARWWAALNGEGQRSLRAANEVSPHIDPNGSEDSPPEGGQVAPHLDPDGTEVAPHLDPNG